MATITVTVNASCTLDGMASAASCTQVASVQDFAQFTRDVSAVPVNVFAGNWSFVAIVNTGDVEIIAQVQVNTDYPIFSVPPDTHLVLPSTFIDLLGTETLGSNLTIYTASGTSRAIVLIGINNT